MFFFHFFTFWCIVSAKIQFSVHFIFEVIQTKWNMDELCLTGSSTRNVKLCLTCWTFTGCRGFFCSEKVSCLPAKTVCNQKEDCPDGTDEINCPTAASKTPVSFSSPHNTFLLKDKIEILQETYKLTYKIASKTAYKISCQDSYQDSSKILQELTRLTKSLVPGATLSLQSSKNCQTSNTASTRNFSKLHFSIS